MAASSSVPSGPSRLAVATPGAASVSVVGPDREMARAPVLRPAAYSLHSAQIPSARVSTRSTVKPGSVISSGFCSPLRISNMRRHRRQRKCEWWLVFVSYRTGSGAPEADRSPSSLNSASVA